MNREIWQQIKGFEGFYSVSNKGNVKHDKTTKGIGTGNYAREEHFIKHRINNKGYAIVDLYKGNKRSQLLVHRLVANAFLPNPNNLPQVNHINGNKNDNRVQNLEWCTQEQNMLHAFKIGLAKPSDKQKRAIAETNKAKRKAVVFKQGSNVQVFESISKASKETGLSISTISRYCRGIRAGNIYSKWSFYNSEQVTRPPKNYIYVEEQENKQ